MGQSSQPTSLLILGLGRVGSLLAEQAVSRWDVVYGTTRDFSKSENDTQIRPIPWTAVQASLTESSCRHVLITTPPLDPQLIVPLQQELKDHLVSSSWIGVISTTSVYGDHQGAWVNETSPCCGNPDYLAWEKQWQDFGKANGHRVRVFRCAGIYGNSRSSLHTIFSKGMPSEPTSMPSSPAVTNRIHESDLIASVLGSMEESVESTKSEFEIYNLADNEPATRQEVFRYARGLMETSDIPILAATSTDSSSVTKSSRATRRGREIKRVSNRKMRKHLLPELLYPTYREGLEDILRQPGAPWNLTNRDDEQNS